MYVPSLFEIEDLFVCYLLFITFEYEGTKVPSYYVQYINNKFYLLLCFSQNYFDSWTLRVFGKILPSYLRGPYY